MPVRIARGARSTWRRGLLHFRIQSTAEPTALRRAIDRVAARILLSEDDDLDDFDTEPEYGAKFVSDIVVLPDGVAFWVDSPDASASIADRIVAAITEALDAEDIDGRLSAPVGDPGRIGGPQVALTAVPAHPPVREALPVLPWDEVARAFEWATEVPSSDVFVYSGGATLELPAQAALELVAFLLRTGQSTHVTVDGPDERRQLSIRHPGDPLLGDEYPHLGLACGGPVIGRDIDGAFEEMIGWARTVGTWAGAVQVTVRPEAHYGTFISSAWSHRPTGLDTTVALDDHLLDAFPWQRIGPEQARRLPDPLPDLLALDGEHGELRVGTLDHWLREMGGERQPDFLHVARASLGRALVTRDTVWVRMHQLPSSLPRASDDPPFEEPQLDLSAVPIVSHVTGHPSLGVTPLELFSLLRGGSFDDRVDASAPIRALLGRLGRVGPEDRERVRHFVWSLRDVDLGGRDQLFHCQILWRWLLNDLTPSIAEAAGAGGDGLRERIASTIQGPVSGTMRLLLDALTGILERQPDLLDGKAPRTSIERTISAIASGVADAASTARVRGADGQREAAATVRRMIHQRVPFTDEARQEIWNAAVGTIGASVVLEAFNRAAVAEPRVAHIWRGAEPGPFDLPKRGFARAAASAPFRTDDPERAWDIAVERGSAAHPDFWRELDDELRARLPEAVVDAGWAAARRRLAHLHPYVTPVAIYAATGSCASILCEALALTVREPEEPDRLREVTWAALDDLGAALATPPA